MVYCRKCGSENPDDSAFCQACGERFTATPAEGQEAAEQTVADEESLLRDRVSDRYEVLHRLGSGGMASVYLARELALDREVALKVLPQAYLRDEEFVHRFVREAQVAANLEHPHIVSIYAINQDPDLVYFAMNVIPGGSLSDRLREGGAQSEEDIVRWGGEVCSALSYAHDRGIVHRDLKPDNIMLDGQGRAVVMDFGIARAREGTRLTQTGTAIGTPHYMSPEQALGKELDGRSDLYSLGVVLYQLSTGSVPFSATDPASLIYQHVHEVPEAPDVRNASVSPWLRDVILKCLAKEPEDRFSSAQELADALLSGGLADED